MKHSDTISSHQFLALVFLSVLPPLIRRFPQSLAQQAGRSAWLAIPLAAPLLLLLYAAVRRLLRALPEGCGLSELFQLALGKRCGLLLTALYAVWFVLYAGFVLRTDAHRFLSTIYPDAGPAVFVLAGAVACGVAASGPLRALGRTAMLLRPLLAAIPALVFLLTMEDADFSLLFPVTAAELPRAGLGALELANPFGAAVWLFFFGGQVRGNIRGKDAAIWAAVLLGIAAMITVGCLGMFGPALTASMSYPFFLLARDVTILGALERVEPAAVAVWVFADFVFISLLLRLAARNLRVCFGAAGQEERSAPWLGAVCAFLAAVCALLLPADAARYARISECIIPVAAAVTAFALPLPAAVLWKLRSGKK